MKSSPSTTSLLFMINSNSITRMRERCVPGLPSEGLGTRLKTREAMHFIEDIVKELNEAIKTECAEAFSRGDHDKAVKLLPCVQEPQKSCSSELLLHLAAARGWADVVKELVTKYDFDPACLDSIRSMPLHEAARGGHIDVVRLLTETFRSPPDSENANGDTPLVLACEEGHLDTVMFLATEFECNVNARHGESKDAALHCACRSGNLEIVQYLVLARKANVKEKNVDGNTPIHVCGSPDTMHFLLSTSDIDPSSKGSQGMMPLHYACGRGWIDIVKYLIEEKNCDPQCCRDQGRDDGFTLLHSACINRQVEVVQYLLSTGKVDPMAKSLSGIIPLELAGGSYEIYSLFAPFESCRVSFPVDSIVKVFHLGNSAAGKSSLAQVLFEHTLHASEHKFIASENVSGVKNLQLEYFRFI